MSTCSRYGVGGYDGLHPSIDEAIRSWAYIHGCEHPPEFSIRLEVDEYTSTGDHVRTHHVDAWPNGDWKRCLDEGEVTG